MNKILNEEEEEEEENEENKEENEESQDEIQNKEDNEEEEEEAINKKQKTNKRKRDSCQIDEETWPLKLRPFIRWFKKMLSTKALSK